MSAPTGFRAPEAPSSTLELALITAAHTPRDSLPLIAPQSVVLAGDIRYKLGLVLSETGLPASIIDNAAFRTFIRCYNSSQLNTNFAISAVDALRTLQPSVTLPAAVSVSHDTTHNVVGSFPAAQAFLVVRQSFLSILSRLISSSVSSVKNSSCIERLHIQRRARVPPSFGNLHSFRSAKGALTGFHSVSPSLYQTRFL